MQNFRHGERHERRENVQNTRAYRPPSRGYSQSHALRTLKTIRRQNLIVETLVGALVCTTVQTQQYAIPRSAAEVSGSAPGIAVTKAYVQSVGRMAYLWGWPLPDFGDRFWVFPFYDARTDEFSEIGQQYVTKPGFYLMVGPNWEAETPAAVTAVVRSSTPLVFVIPRIFMDDTLADHAAIQPLVSQVIFYPPSEFDGKTKIKDWSKLPYLPAPESTGERETKWVNPETFFDELPEVMKQVPPLPGEEGLYQWIGSVLEAAAKDPENKKVLTDTAVASERELISPLIHWRRHNGGSLCNHFCQGPVPSGQGFLVSNLV
jgi:hypothetical protein